MNRLAVLGQPIAHSLSPRMHAAAFRALGIDSDWSYEAIELSPDAFADGVQRLRREGYAGANVTIPHKARALDVASAASAAARAIGAANTLSFSADEIRAENTDAPGLIAALPIELGGARALVLGAGGAGRAAAWALKGAGARVDVHNRTHERAAGLAREIGVTAVESAGSPPLRGYDVIVNATSVGLDSGAASGGSENPRAGSELKELGFGADELTDRMVVVDLVYGSSPTELVSAADRAGAIVVDGHEILVRQGAESFRIWTGREPPLEAMRAAVKISKEPRE